MRKVVGLSFVAAFLYAGNLVAQGQSVNINIDEVSAQAKQELAPIFHDLFEMLDIDSNGKLSRNEIAEFAKGSLQVKELSDAEKIEMMDEINSDFDKFDKDKDEWLNKEEGEAYLEAFQDKIVKKQLSKIDQDYNRVLSEKELNDLMQSRMAKADEAMKSLEEANKKLQEINDNPEVFVDNMLKNIAAQQAGEQFYQMDKNRNNEIDSEEYINYMLATYEDEQAKADVKEKFVMTNEDFKNLFDGMDSNKKGFLTKEEYVAKYVEMTSIPIDEEMGKLPENLDAQ